MILDKIRVFHPGPDVHILEKVKILRSLFMSVTLQLQSCDPDRLRESDVEPRILVDLVLIVLSARLYSRYEVLCDSV